MNTKSLIVVLVIVVITIFVLGISEPQNAGKFQIIPVKVFTAAIPDANEKGSGAVGEMAVCFKLDTTTGKTWTYYEIIGGRAGEGKVFRYWREVPDKPMWIPYFPSFVSD